MYGLFRVMFLIKNINVHDIVGCWYFLLKECDCLSLITTHIGNVLVLKRLVILFMYF